MTHRLLELTWLCAVLCLTGLPAGASEAETTQNDDATTQAAAVTCKGSGNVFRPARIEDGASMGRDVSFDDCLKAVRAANEGVVCGLQRSGQYRPRKVEDLATVGADMAFDDCLKATGAAHDDLVCAKHSDGLFRQRRISSNTTIGGSMSLDQCVSL